MFKTLIFYPDEREASDIAVFQTHLRAEQEECLMSEIQPSPVGSQTRDL